MSGKGTVRLNGWIIETLLDNCFTELRRYLGGDPWSVDVLREDLHRIDKACLERGHTEGSSTARRQLQYLTAEP